MCKAQQGDTTATRHVLEHARALSDSGRFREALQLNQQALDSYQKTVGEDHILRAKGYNWRSAIYLDSGARDQSLLAVTQSMKINKNPSQAYDSLVQAHSYQLLGAIKQGQGAYDTALIHYHQALSIQQAINGMNHPSVAFLHNYLAHFYREKGQYELALTQIDSAMAIAAKLSRDTADFFARIYSTTGWVYQDMRIYDLALEYYQKSLQRYMELWGSGHPKLAEIYHNLAKIYTRIYDHDKALAYLDKALALRLTVSNDRHWQVGFIYLNYGAIWDDRGDFDLALQYYEKALEIMLKTQGPSHFKVGMLYYNMGSSYDDKGDYVQASDYYWKAIEILRSNFGDNHPYIAGLYNNLGILYKNQGGYELALTYYDKSIAMYRTLGGDNNPRLPRIYHNIGLVYELTGKYEQALAQYRHAIDIMRVTVGENHPEIAVYYSSMGFLYLELEDDANSWMYFHKAYHVLAYDPSVYDDFLQVPDFFALYWVLKGMEGYYQKKYQRGQDPRYLDSLQTHYQTMLAFEEYTQQNYTTSSTRLHYASQARPTFEGAINNLLARQELEDLTHAFSLAEKTKSRQLAEHLQVTSPQNSYGLPDSLIQQEQDVAVAIAEYETKSYQEKYETAVPNDSILSSYNDQLFVHRQARNQLLASFKKSYPAYYQLRYSQQVIDIEAVQQDLLSHSNQALIEYFVGDSNIFIFVILRDTFHLLSLNRDFPLEQWVSDMRCALIADYHPSFSCHASDSIEIEERERYAQSAFQLYQKIFEPIQGFLSADITEIILIPDGILAYVPFEALISRSPEGLRSYAAYEYLLKKYTISYAYSATLQQEMQNKQHQQTPTKNLLAFAPSFSQETDEARLEGQKTNQLKPLIYNTLEARNIGKILKGKVVTDNAATKATFIRQANAYRILHLSTHGKANDRVGDYAYLAFHIPPESEASQETWRLYNRDLYNMKLNADMVVLSACETGIGELQHGEGIISLARGFSYAGAKSIITSLWSVDDRSTKTLMESFYSYLKLGLPKHQALRKAKLDYLEAHPGFQKSPFFWATFILIGDTKSVDLEDKQGMYWAFGLGLLLLLGILLYLKRAKGSNSAQWLKLPT